MTRSPLTPDLRERLSEYAQARGLTEREALDQLIPKSKKRAADPEALTPAEKRQLTRARAQADRGEVVDGPTALRSLGLL